MVSNAAHKMSNWRAPGPDGIHTFWMKHLSSLHPRLASQIQNCVDGEVPRWLTLGRTVLIMKNKEVGPEVVTNYRPITCVSNLWKLATSMMSAAIVCHLNRNQVWPWEQKGCKRGSRGTKDHLLVDKLVMFLTRRRHQNLQMTWIDYQKAYYFVPHSWFVKIFAMYKFAPNIQHILKISMSSRTTLTLNGRALGNVEIKRGIFRVIHCLLLSL